MEIIMAVAGKAAEYLVAPIGRQLGCVFNYHSYLDDVKKQVDQLDDAMRRRQRRVGEAKTQGEEIEDDVQKWLTDAAATIETSRKIIEDEEAAKKSCFNVKWRYLRSREAKKQTRDIAELIQKNNNFTRVSYRLPPQRTWSTCLRGIEIFETRAETFNQIMEALKTDDIKLIGVWGMGGVGKTTLANQVMKQAEEDNLFDKVVMASNISQFPNVSKIQEEIAGTLDLKFEANEPESVRVDRLRKSLNNHKRLLVILDDLWKELNLEKIGIPSGREGCKVLLTSRNRDLLSNWMRTQKNFEVKQLSEEEALSLFKKLIASDADEDPDLPLEAREVAEICDGLPVAIVTIAKALKGKSVAVWRNALEELNRAEPTNIPGVSENVYSCLQLSYNYLKGDEVKHLFLLCGMLDSCDISMDQLLQYVLGLDLFQHNLSLQQATDKLVTLVQILKDSSLFLETEDIDYYQSADQLFFEPDDIKFIRMHDVVRDVARAIASKDPQRFMLKEAPGFEEWQKMDDELINCTHISLNGSNIQRFPEKLVCPKLEFFFLVDPRSKIPDTFFEEMKQLKVLHLEDMDLWVLPSSLNALSNLQSVCLTGCRLGDVAILGALKKLRVLSFVGSNSERLPEEMMQLNNLRVLDLSSSGGLRVIPRNVISSLSGLEYLCVGKSFTEWGAKRFDNDGETNACLSELTNLSNLKTLVINAGNHNLLPEDAVFENLIRYDIVMARDDWTYRDKEYSRVLKIEGIQSLHDLVNRSSKLLKTTQALPLIKLDDGEQSLCHEFVREGFPKLKLLCIEESGGIQVVFNSTEWAPSHCAFPILELLYLRILSNLDAVWYGPIPKGSFCHLRELRLKCCRRLKYAMLLSQTQEREFVFPHLKYIELEMLPESISFCSTETSLIKESSTTSDAQTPFFNQQVALPSLESLRMYELDMVGTVWQDQLHAGSFRKLKSLDIESCPTLRNVYLLRSLETLKIAYCDSLDEILDVECNEEIRDISAAPLRELSLEKLPCLKSTWYKQDPRQERATFQNLRVLKVWDCPLGTHLFPATVAKGLENLETLRVDGCEVEEIVAYKNADVAAPSLFPKLTSLKLNRLGKLRCIYGGTTSHTLQWPLLKDLEVCYCRKVEVLFHGLGSDAEADINGIISAQPPLFFVQKDTFPNLEKLSLKGTMKIWQGQFSNESFGKLEHLEVTECNDISAVTSSTIIPILSNLKHLHLTICNSGKEVYQVEEQPGFSHILGSAWIRENLSSLVVSDCENLMYLLAPPMAKNPVKLEVHTIEKCSKGKDIVSTEANAATDELVFAKLESVELRNLPNLKSFGSTRSPLKFPSLKVMRVEYCPAMESFCGTFSESTHLLINGLPELTQLCMQISGLFQNLQNIHTLVVRNCQNLRYLVTSSVAKNLVQLIELDISRCCMMTEVVGTEGDDDATSDIEFPKLRRLTLDALSKLKWFCSARNYTFRFPSLEKLEIYHCNEMEFFCEGVLITPRPVTFNRSDVQGDLNTAIKKKIALENDSKVEDSQEGDSKEEDSEGEF